MYVLKLDSFLQHKPTTALFDAKAQPRGLQIRPFLLIASAGGEGPEYYADNLYQLKRLAKVYPRLTLLI